MFDHIDLRVSDLRRDGEFYRQLLPMLGFRAKVEIDGWIQFEGEGTGPAAFFGVTEDPAHVPNQTRIAFWAESRARVDELAKEIRRIGARIIEGPDEESPTYYAVYFEDLCGNRLEICYRSARF